MHATTSRTGPGRFATDPDEGTATRLHFEGAAPYGPVPVADPDATAGDVLHTLAGRRFESAAHIAACRDGRLVGVARIEDVPAADPGALLSELMDSAPPVVA